MTWGAINKVKMSKMAKIEEILDKNQKSLQIRLTKSTVEVFFFYSILSEDIH